MLNRFSAMIALPIAAMILVNFVMVGAGALSKAAMTSGLSQYVYIVYYDAFATMILLPWFVHHCLSGKRLPITFSLLCRFFGLSLIGRCIFPICVHTGLRYTSMTVGAAIGNLTPIFTYLIAISLRMERLDIRKSVDQLKVVGTIVAVSGALVVTLYKGPALLGANDSLNSTRKLVSEQSNWPLGCLLYTLGFLLRSIWNIFQADTAKLYPDEITIVFFCTVFGSIQTTAATFFLVEDQSAWRLTRKIEIIAIVYAAVSLSIVTNTIVTWCLRKKGPVFVSMFDPLNIAIAAFMGFVFLADGIYLGSVIGSATIIVGFYAVMWGQSRTTSDMVNKVGGLESASSSSQEMLFSDICTYRSQIHICDNSIDNISPILTYLIAISQREHKRSRMEKRLPFVAMIVLQFVIIGSSTLCKSAMTSGLSPYVFVVYYKGLGTVFLLPWFACHCLRGKRLPLTFRLLCKFFALSLIGSCLSPICLFTGLSFTSVTIGASISNLTPIFTYLIAICLRMEKIDLRKYVDQIKALGTFVAVLGALVVTLYKGPSLLSNSAHQLFSEHSNWPLGCVLYTLGFLLVSMWNILQADTAKLYPDEVTIVFFCSFFGSIQNVVASFFMVKDSSAWHLNLNVQIIAVVYTAFMVSVVINPVVTWCLRKKGPVFVSMFDPLNVAIAALAGFVFLADGIYLGSVIGSAGIIGGFYAVMWGQAKTTSDMVNKIGCLESASSQVTPLLQTSQITGYTERP